MTALTPDFWQKPFAHRALHGAAGAENSIGAIDAAIAAGFGIEIDVQRSADGVAMVFHDYDLARLTGETGQISGKTSTALRAVALTGGGGAIPTLADVLKRIAGRAPVLVEIKDQDGQMGPNVGPLERAVTRDLSDYEGPVAVMSFNPHSMRIMRDTAPHIPRGLVTCAYRAESWPELPANTRSDLARIPDVDDVGASFISHEASALSMPVVAELKARGLPVFCWTIRSAAQEKEARLRADQITFEGYTPA